MKIAFHVIISGLDTADERNSEIEDLETSRAETQRENELKKKKEEEEEKIQEVWVNYKRYNICIMGIPEGWGKEKGIEEIFETVMTESFPKFMSDTKL